MTPGATSNSIVEVEFVCRNCREGKHGCPGYWTGLGLGIRCTCACAVRVGSAGKENIQDDDDSKQSTTSSTSKLEPNTTILTNPKEPSQRK
jgi:hypothetical protein